MSSPKIREHPVVEKTFTKKRAVESTKQSLYLCFRSLVVTLALYLDLHYQLSASFFEINSWLYWILQSLFLCLSALNFVANIVNYIVTSQRSVVEVTASQKKLLGIQDNEPGFKTAQPKPAAPPPVIDSIISPSTFCGSPASASFYGNSSSLFGNSFGKSPSGASPQMSVSPSLFPSSGYQQQSSLLSSPAGFANSSSANASYNMPGQSAAQHSFATPEPANFSAANLSAISAPATSPYPLDAHSDVSGVRHRLQNTSLRRSPMYTDACIKDMKEFSQFLKEHDESSHDVTQSHDGSTGNATAGQSFWNFNRSVSDMSPMLRKYAYQIACRSPATSKTKRDDRDDAAADSGMAEEFWSKAGSTLT